MYCGFGEFISYQEQRTLERHYREIMGTVTCFLYRYGYFGSAGVDVMTDENGNQLVVDLNV